MPAYLSSEGPLLNYELPDYRYYPTKLLPAGTRDWSRVQFLQACERLRIPHELWPKFELLELPPNAGYCTPAPVFTSPPFDVLRDSATKWRQKAEKLFQQHCDGFLQKVSNRTKRAVAQGVLTKIKRPMGNVPLALRFEWAAKRYCLGERYKDMATATYGDVAIRQAVMRILRAVKLENVTQARRVHPSQDPKM